MYLLVKGEDVFQHKLEVASFVWIDSPEDTWLPDVIDSADIFDMSEIKKTDKDEEKDKTLYGLASYSQATGLVFELGEGPYYRDGKSELMIGNAMRRYLLTAFVGDWLDAGRKRPTPV
jgi:hypothetical protein